MTTARRRTCGARTAHPDFVVADAGRAARPHRGRLPLNGRWLYSSGCDHCDWAFLGGVVPGERPAGFRLALLPGAAQGLRDRRYLARLRPQGDRQPGHRGQGRLRPRLPRPEGDRPLSTARVRARRSTRRRSIASRRRRSSISASPAARSARCRAWSTPFATMARKRATPRGSTADDPIAQLACAEAAALVDELKLVLHRNLNNLMGLAERREVPSVERAPQVQIPFRLGRRALRPCRAQAVQGIGRACHPRPICRSAASSPTSMPRRQHVSNQPGVFRPRLGRHAAGRPAADEQLI